MVVALVENCDVSDLLDSVKVFWKQPTGRPHPCLKNIIVLGCLVLRQNRVFHLQNDLHAVLPPL